jgi:DNA-3-methyladenine glycosylase I
MTDDLPRCRWAQGDPLMLEGFQAGLAWIVILRKREAFRQAFVGFNPEAVARFGESDVAQLLTNPGIVRSRAKIEATIRGAQIWCEMAERGEDFADFCWSFTDGAAVRGDGLGLAKTPLSGSASKALKQRGFKFVGPTIVHAWMQAVGIVDDHAPNCFRRVPA